MTTDKQTTFEEIAYHVQQPCRAVSITNFWIDGARRCTIREGQHLVYKPEHDGGPLDLLAVRDESLMIDVESDGENGIVDEIQHRLAELWIALVDTSADMLTPGQAAVRERLQTLFVVEDIDPDGTP